MSCKVFIILLLKRVLPHELKGFNFELSTLVQCGLRAANDLCQQRVGHLLGRRLNVFSEAGSESFDSV
ncbi:hypothetical protein EVAR_13649_1 [Eumeta japonica]|uniref:Uncharacterized protein n=1 Tax=Eumeta variegata TaxID=151549 RepID=A0A4C1UTH1_EUMVA|nr:hypothetical protein EVAR_13649_1 [Eumeta japonica]